MPSAPPSRANRGRAARGESEAGFDLGAEVLVEPQGWWAALRLVALGGAALVLLWLAVVYATRSRWENALVFGALGLICGYMAARGGTRILLRGDAFELQGLLENTSGRAADFIGWASALRGGILLLRRDDLRWVRLPQVMVGSDDRETVRWALTFLPSVDSDAINDLRSAPEPSRSLALSRLQAPPGPVPEIFDRAPRSLELACAARTVERRGYVEARASLHALLEQLPAASLAAVFVLDALRVVGDASSAALLARLAEKFATRSQGHYARALGALATPAERATLLELSRSEDVFVRETSRRALARFA